MTALRRHSSHADGFTLLEVVVALAILGGSLFVLLHAHLNALDANDRQLRAVVLGNLIGQAIGQAETELSAGKTSGSNDFGKRFEEYSYAFEAQLVGEQYPNLYELTITVETPDEEYITSVFTYAEPAQ
jgi:prepilin-type N-terminal cleavage/methylation domain-containing protein